LRTDKVLLVFRKDWLEIKRNKEVLLPIIVLPIVISFVLQAILTLIPRIDIGSGSSADLELLLRSLPTYVRGEIAGLSPSQAIAYLMTVYLFAPFFLIIPIMASSVISADSFAGEKERKTIEALLATPISDSELLLGKILVSFIPSMVITLISFVAYSAVVDFLSLSFFSGRILLPNLLWAMMILLLAPLMAVASIGLTVTVSARVKGFREAQQISVVLIIPVLALILGQLSGVMILGPLTVAAVAAVLAAIDAAIFYTGVKLFNREEILPRLS
jgi:ABC-2 type transport system permease protein